MVPEIPFCFFGLQNQFTIPNMLIRRTYSIYGMHTSKLFTNTILFYTHIWNQYNPYRIWIQICYSIVGVRVPIQKYHRFFCYLGNEKWE